jgi:hypothetical protein
MFRSHKISTTTGFNNVLPCSIRKAVPRRPIVVVPAIPMATDCDVVSQEMNAVQNTLLTTIVDLLASKHSRTEATFILGELEQTLLTKCVNNTSTTATAKSSKCC